MIFCRIVKETAGLNRDGLNRDGLNRDGHLKTFGNGGTPVSFLAHQMNHRRQSNRLVINFGRRKSSIIFPEFGYFLGKKN